MNVFLDRKYICCCLYNTDDSKELSSYVNTLKQNEFKIFGEGELFNPYIIVLSRENFAEELERLSLTLNEIPLRLIPENNHSPYVFDIYLDDECQKQREKECEILKEILDKVNVLPKEKRQSLSDLAKEFFESKKEKKQ